MAKICNSKPVKIVLIVAIVILAIVFGFVFYQKCLMNSKKRKLTPMTMFLMTCLTLRT